METYLLFRLLGLPADLGKVVGRVEALADLSLHLRDKRSWLISFTIDTSRSIVEYLISCDGVFEIEMPLGNMLLDDGPKVTEME